ncbi:MAG: 3-mercaptopyruvate sulfurtransferase [Gemmatimonadaceae bacterium]
MAPVALPVPLVSTRWLVDHLDASDLKLVDATMHLPIAQRDARAEFATGHIPGAVFADIDWLSDEHSSLPHTLLDAENFGARIGALGITNDDAVIVYDTSGQNYSAPRFWWMLRTFGHQRVAVLDGGMRRWIADGRPLEQGIPTPTPKMFRASFDSSRVRTFDAMRANVVSHAEQVVDARSAGRFEGSEPEPRLGVRSGHIPGARSLHYASLVESDGTMKSADAIRETVEAAGLDLDQPIVASCGSGVTACAVVLALESLGAPRLAVYDGSWTEWGGRDDTPVATGAAT